MDLNPGFPGAFGVEWPANESHYTILGKTPARLVELPATTAETIDSFRLQIDDTGETGSRFLSLIEVFDAGITVPDSTIPVCTPNADAPGSTIAASGWRRDPGAVLTNLWQAIDDPYAWPPPPSATSTYIETASGSSTPYHVYFDTSGVPANRRIIRLRFRAVIGALLGSGPYNNRQFAVRAVYDPGGAGQAVYGIPGGYTLWGTGYTTPVDLDLGEINPVTRLPWTSADMAEFNGGDWAIRIEAIGNSATTAVVQIAELRVSHVPENRVAVGVWERPSGQGPGLIETDQLVSMPAGTPGWPKPASGQFKFGWRIADDRLLRPAGVPSQSSVGWLAARARVSVPVTPPQVAVGQIRGATASNDQYGRYTSEPEFSSSAHVPVLQMMVGSSVSVDSFAYGMAPDSTGVAVANASTQVAQRITPPSAQSYIGVRTVVSPPAASADSTLTITINRVSDGVQMGGALTVTSAEVRDTASTPVAGSWIVEGFLSAGASLASGVQYEIRFTVAGPGSWSFPRLRAVDAAGWTFGGSGNSLRVGGTVHSDSDTPVIILQQPARPSQFNTQVMPVVNGEGVDCRCAVPAVDIVALNWVNPAISGFDRTEVWRYEDRGDWPIAEQAWELVHVNRTSAGTTESWSDWTAPRDVPVQYRLRNFTTTGAFSEWRYSEWVTPHPYGCELIFTSNQDPSLTVVYQHEPKVDFDFLDHRTDRLVPLEGRAYQVAFTDPTDRGVSRRLRIIANFGKQPCDSNGRPIPKDAVFDPLRRISRAQLPYVVVLDSKGGRVLAHVELAGGVNEEPAFRYYVDAVITPIADRIRSTES